MFFSEMNLLLILLLFIVAILYSSVGHGGASGYLAVMALFDTAAPLMKSSALVLNIFVSFIAFIQYYRSGNFRWKLFFPFAIASVPLAFIGASLMIDNIIYKKILGVILIFPILSLFGFFKRESVKLREINISISIVFGAFIGFLSGLLGIGGGIILSPLILLLHYGNMKQAASVTALFVFVNSIAGFISLINKEIKIDNVIYSWLIISIIGGFIGAYAGSRKWNNTVLKKVLAIVLCIASFKLLFS